SDRKVVMTFEQLDDNCGGRLSSPPRE
ncbi:hypothetical protein A2U01_0075682, partial [Trifolium medium]|nr:hypothetical protein [Trifolium medium]